MWRILIEAQKITLTSSSVSQSNCLICVTLSSSKRKRNVYSSLQLAIAKFSRAVVASISKLPKLQPKMS